MEGFCQFKGIIFNKVNLLEGGLTRTFLDPFVTYINFLGGVGGCGEREQIKKVLEGGLDMES